MKSVEDQAAFLHATYTPQLSLSGRKLIQADLNEGDVDMLIDDILQFTLVDGVTIPPDTLDDVDNTIHEGGYDPELLGRSLGWLARHREKLHQTA